MFGLFGKKKKDERPQILLNYPVFDRPYPGDPGLLSDQEVEQNIQHLKNQHLARVEIVTNFLKTNDIDVRDLSPREFFLKLDDIELWLINTFLPTVLADAPRHFKKVSRLDWPIGFDGQNIIYSFLLDLGILCFHYQNMAFNNRMSWGILGTFYLDENIPESYNPSIGNQIVAWGLCDAFDGRQAPDYLENFFVSTVRAYMVHDGPPIFMGAPSETFLNKLNIFEPCEQ